MEITGKGFIFFFVGILIACLFAVFTAHAQEVIINDTPLSEVTISVPVSDEVSSGDISDIANSNVVVVTADVIVSDLKSDIDLNTSLDVIEKTQERIFDLQGEYEQVKGIVNVYQSSEGFGYQVVEKLQDKLIYTGYGVNAENYTYIVDISSLPTF